MTKNYSVTAKGAELMALMEAFSRLTKRASKETDGIVGLPDVKFTLDELLEESSFPPDDGQTFVDSLVAQGYLCEEQR